MPASVHVWVGSGCFLHLIYQVLRKQAEGLITAMIAWQAIICVALSKDADSDLMPTVCMCAWRRRKRRSRRRRDYCGSYFVCAYVCMWATVFWYAFTTFPGKSRLNYWRMRVFFFFFFSNIYVCMFVLLIHLRDAVWSVYPSREVLLCECANKHTAAGALLYLHQDMTHPSSTFLLSCPSLS